MPDLAPPAEALLREAGSILARKSGLDALKTASCPPLARSAQVFTDSSTGWTTQEVQHFRSCPYCYEVGLAFSKASRKYATTFPEPSPSGLRRAVALLGKLVGHDKR
jgi:hypothetical protein